MESLLLRPIGVVHSPLSDPAQAPQQGPEAGTLAVIELEPQWAQGLTGLAPGRDLWVICHFHLSPGPKLMVHPRGDRDRPPTGVFNTRSPRRPCPLSLTLVRLLAIDEGPAGPRLTVRGLEAVAGTPVLDLKPYAPGLDQPSGDGHA